MCGAGGTLLAVWLVRLFVRLEPGNIPRLEAAAVDLRVLAFALGISLLAGVVTGLAPLLGNPMEDLLSPLKDTDSAEGRKGRRIRVPAVQLLHARPDPGTPPMEFADEARSIVWGIDPDLPVRRMISMEEQVAYWLAEPRFYSMLFGLFSLSALLLALAGIYGVVSYSVSRQRREIGVRMALGATRGLTLRSVLGRGIRLALIGSLLGAAGAVAATRLIRGLLFQVEPGDPLSLAGVTALLLAGTVMAVLLPAARATRVDPVEALRVE